ncbi:MAG: HD domain-containing protein [Desulfovibrionaceae bacterium]|nr:HD domain-containing protein [Desulfovibrionaceae bacterium]MBF0513037.1 HD domain-containing protein [Desulfovibrionaceae bacterium]
MTQTTSQAPPSRGCRDVMDVSPKLYSLILSVADALDLISPELASHHKRVAYVASLLAKAAGLRGAALENVVVAALLHDAGGLTLKSKLMALEFEHTHSEHEEYGYKLLRDAPSLGEAAALVRRHHAWWGREAHLPLGCHILHLADRVDALVDKRRQILDQAGEVTAAIAEHAGLMFDPKLTELFREIAARESFWFDLASPRIGSLVLAELTANEGARDIDLGADAALEFSRFIAQLIDFRSRFTATHSSGVAACSVALAAKAGLSAKELDLIRVAGYLHDLGKLAVPAELIEKPGTLTDSEMNVMKSHTYLSYHILSRVAGLEQVAAWASFHHERLNGSGYPFRLRGEDIAPQARIIAAADIFTAMTEDRPYRAATAPKTAVGVLKDMAAHGLVDQQVVAILAADLDAVHDAREQAQTRALEQYRNFYRLS